MKIKITPGKQYSPTEAWTPEKHNQGFKPTAELEEPIATEDLDPEILSPLDRMIVPNYIQNGDFAIAQRPAPWGTGSFSLDDAEATKHLFFGPDRWGWTKWNAQTPGQTTITRGFLRNGSNSLPVSDYWLIWTQTTPLPATYINNPAIAFLAQRIENVGTLAGKKATLALRVLPTINCTIGLQLSQHFGRGGGASPDVDLPPVNKNLIGGQWQDVAATFDLPSIFGKVQGTDTEDNTVAGWSVLPDFLEARIIMPAGTAFVMNFGEVGLYEGTTAPPFRRIDPAVELPKTQRYYERVFAQVATSVSSHKPPVYFKVTKRGAASVGQLPQTPPGSPFGTFWEPTDVGMTWQFGAGSVLATAALRIDAELCRHTSEHTD